MANLVERLDSCGRGTKEKISFEPIVMIIFIKNTEGSNITMVIKCVKSKYQLMTYVIAESCLDFIMVKESFFYGNEK